MVLEQIAFAAILIAGIISTYTDWKTGYIYDWITYPLIGLGIILTILTQQWIGVLLAVLIYGIGLLAYNSGKMGGGDIKLLTGIALVQPLYQGMIFVLAVLLLAALSACVVLCIYYVGKFLLSKPKIHWNTKRKKIAAMLLFSVLAYGWFSLQMALLPAELGLFFFLALVLGVIFYAFEDEVKTHAFLKRIPLEKLEDDEILAVEHLNAEEKNRFGKHVPALIGTEDTLKLKHMGFTTIPVYRDLPKFAPFLLIGILAVYLFPQMLVGWMPVLL